MPRAPWNFSVVFFLVEGVEVAPGAIFRFPPMVHVGLPFVGMLVVVELLVVGALVEVVALIVVDVVVVGRVVDVVDVDVVVGRVVEVVDVEVVVGFVVEVVDVELDVVVGRVVDVVDVLVEVAAGTLGSTIARNAWSLVEVVRLDATRTWQFVKSANPLFGDGSFGAKQLNSPCGLGPLNGWNERFGSFAGNVAFPLGSTTAEAGADPRSQLIVGDQPTAVGGVPSHCSTLTSVPGV